MQHIQETSLEPIPLEPTCAVNEEIKTISSLHQSPVHGVMTMNQLHSFTLRNATSELLRSDI
jgi:hypothetical protein